MSTSAVMFPPHHMTIRVNAPESCCDLEPGIVQAIRDCVRGLREAPISNAGLRGIEEWATQVLTWPAQFPERSFVDCLTSVFLYIEINGYYGAKRLDRSLGSVRKVRGVLSIWVLLTFRASIRQRRELRFGSAWEI